MANIDIEAISPEFAATLRKVGIKKKAQQQQGNAPLPSDDYEGYLKGLASQTMQGYKPGWAALPGVGKSIMGGLAARKLRQIGDRRSNMQQGAGRDADDVMLSLSSSMRGKLTPDMRGRVLEAASKSRAAGLNGRASNLIAAYQRKSAPVSADEKMAKDLIKLKYMKAKADLEGTKAKPKLTKGQEFADKSFAKDTFIPWLTTGKSQSKADLNKLDEALTALDKANSKSKNYDRSAPSITGWRSYLPDVLNSTPAIDTREKVESIVQRNLKAILGGAFSEKEGKQLIERAYNPILDESVIYKRVSRLREVMSQAGKAKQAMADYFDQHGTLTGYKGPKPPATHEEFNALVTGKGGGKKPKAKRLRYNPNTGRVE